MRGFQRGVMVVAMIAAMAPELSAQPPDAAQVLAAARIALGGEQSLSAVKTFVATGRTRLLRGNNLVPIEFEITCELPDKFVRRDEIPAQDTDPTTTGFRGDELIQFPLPAGPGRPGGAPPAPPPGGGGGRGPANPMEQRLLAVKQDFARLTLGIFAASFPPYPLSFTYAAQAEAPEGIADVIDVAGPANFAARLLVQRATHLPVMLMWQVPAAAAGAKPIEYRVYYADYRDVSGTKWPFRIRRAIAGETVEEMTFDRIRVNVKVDPRKFEASK